MSTDLSVNLRNWQYTGLAVLVGFVAVVVILWPTSVSFIKVWSGGQTYSHGFVILPITLWLVWRQRNELRKVSPSPTLLPLVLLVPASLAWVVGHSVGVLVVEQAAFVTIVLCLVTALVGWRVARFLAFPLLFLYFAVPVGDGLIPPMMEFTATFTVEALRWTGIPVFRDGFWFTLPSGSWSVVEACSGVRYIIASVTLGFLYAYISYHQLWKRLAFIAISAVVPILANGVRAYIIVMIGHLSDMELATGVDHLIYGWIFFGLVMLLLFWIGGFWQEEHPPINTVEADGNRSNPIRSGLLLAVVGTLVVVGAASAFSIGLRAQHVPKQQLVAPKGENGWELVDAPSLLHPTHLRTTYLLDQSYRNGDHTVSLYVAMYPTQRQGYEVVAKRNAVVGNKRNVQQDHVLADWKLKSDKPPHEVRQLELTRKTSEFSDSHSLVWQWYRIAGRDVTNPYEAKAWEAWAKITQGRSDGQWIAIATPLARNISDSQKVLQDFLAANYPALTRSFDHLIKKED